MAVTADILRSWRAPRLVVRDRLAQGVREDRALAMVIGACLLMFLGRLPGYARAAYQNPAIPLDARVGGGLLAMVFLVPLILYGVAGISHIVLRAMGGTGSPYGARLALFWSLLAASPAILLQGLIEGLAGPGTIATITGLAVLIAFLVLWRAALAQVGFPNSLVQG